MSDNFLYLPNVEITAGETYVFKIGSAEVDDVIVPPDVPDEVVVHLAKSQMRQIYERIELIDRHFERCCAFQLDKCQYGEEYDRLYDVLQLAGIPESKTPMDRDTFEQWMTEHSE